MRNISGIAAALALATPALAQYPNKPIRLVVSIAPGGQTDTIARMIGQKMSEGWERPVVVDNRPGGGGTLAAGMVAKAAPDGHTLLFTTGFANSAVLQPNLPYDPLKDFAGVTQIGFGTQVMSVAPALGAKSVKDLIALAKAQPGKIVFGSPPVGTSDHLSGAMFSLAAEIKVATVAFKGGAEALVQTLGGHTHYSIGSLVSALPFITDKKLLALAVTTPQRSPLLPDVPSMAETLPNFKRPATSHGLLAPANTPRPVLNQISKEVARILSLPDIRKRLEVIGYIPAPSTPEEYDKILRAQIETLSKVVRDAGLKAK